ncbi:MAG: MarR family winged helix-turn-helix transcriptional regulator [Methylococcales bacterium]|nr:winged helix-turn-helix transcriptional regulator [Methylococcaceae bacterium]
MTNLKTFKLIERISTLVRSEERKKLAALGLQPIHIQVLDYLDSCNSYSNTAAAITEYFGLTKGTVSQSLQVLERKAFIAKTLDPEDARIFHLTLTEEGRNLLELVHADDVFAQAELAVQNQQYSSIDAALLAALETLQKTHKAPSFGTCDTCVNFDVEDNHYLCSITRLPLFQAETDKICREHIPADAA